MFGERYVEILWNDDANFEIYIRLLFAQHRNFYRQLGAVNDACSIVQWTHTTNMDRTPTCLYELHTMSCRLRCSQSEFNCFCTPSQRRSVESSLASVYLTHCTTVHVPFADSVNLSPTESGSCVSRIERNHFLSKKNKKLSGTANYGKDTRPTHIAYSLPSKTALVAVSIAQYVSESHEMIICRLATCLVNGCPVYSAVWPN